MTYFDAIIMAIVEGLTEFLPVSSTGHIILTQALLHIESSASTKNFIVNIQFGAILSVLAIYYKRFFQSFEFYKRLIVAFIPAAVIGFLLNDYIDALLESVTTVAVSLIVGGIIIILFEKKWKEKNTATTPLAEMSLLQSFVIGLFQCIAMIPGVSRSAATIIGGQTQRLSQKDAAEFSFFLAVPTIAAAAGYKLLKSYNSIQSSDIAFLVIGNVVAFIVAILAIKFFVGYISQKGMTVFGYYRIIIGVVILVALYLFHAPLAIV